MRKLAISLPETVGSENNLFEQTLPKSEAVEADCQDQTAQLQSTLQAHRLGINTGGENGILPSIQDGNIVTFVQDSPQTVQLEHQLQEFSGVDVDASEAAICKKFGLNPDKLRIELESLFSNISQIINILAPDFQNTEPSLSNLLKLICQIKQSLEQNTIHFGNKDFILFDYFLATNEEIIFEVQNNKIVIFNGTKFTVEAFGSKNLNFRFMTFLPQEWELKKHTPKDSSILVGK